MIPIRLRLHQFLSYRSAVLDLTSIHTACICGANGSGKSALLEALTWGIWGQSRAPSDDDLIHKGCKEAQVEVVYRAQAQVYRILRSRSLGSAGTLEWQIETSSGWRSLTRKGIRATQQAIQAQLRLDYETFINSAYLRQGRADEFTLKRPGERKQILAEILKLGVYEQWAEKSREFSRSARLQADSLHEQLQRLAGQEQDRVQLQAEADRLHQQQREWIEQQAADQANLEDLQTQMTRRQSLQQHYQQLTEQLHNLATTLKTTETQWRQQHQQQQELETLLAQEETILNGCRRYQALLTADQQLNQQFQQHQSLQQERQRLQDELREQQHQRLQQLQQRQHQLATLQAQAQADAQILQEAERITAALTAYRQAQAALNRYDQQQAEATPLWQQWQATQAQLQQERNQLQAQHQLLQQQVQHLQSQQAQVQQVQQAVVTLQGELADAEKRRVYHQRVQEKIQERQKFVHQLQERQRTLQRQWQLFEEKRHWIGIPVPGAEAGDLVVLHSCPLCTQPLTPDLRHLVIDKHQEEQKDLEGQLFVIREQLAVADREIEILQREYQALTAELQQLDEQFHHQGRLQHQLESGQQRLQQLHSWQTQLHSIATSLQQETFGAEIRQRLHHLHQQLTQLGYNDKDHALCRAEMERWRWALTKQADLQKAQERQGSLNQEIAHLHAQIRYLQTAPSQGDSTGSLRHLEAQLQTLSYDVAQHQAVRAELTQQQGWMHQWEKLQQAKQQWPAYQECCSDLAEMLQQQRRRFHQTNQQLEQVHHQLAQSPVVTEGQLKGLATIIQQRRQQQDLLLSQLGGIQERLEQSAHLAQQKAQLNQSLQQAKRNQLIYQELANAYGRNGIPALIIENVLPELETTANQILSRLTAHQLHLQFVTQRSGRRSSKLIDTLDILIADPQGTRPYETYSGGEAFRINFAIRLALSRLLAQRSGASLQTLLIDEGFGTQDQTGRQQLVAAINAVSSDFACILVITHIPSLRDAFPHRIEVERSPQGSRLHILS
ncbi:MAG: SMC family ATPase [Cyanobacteriota bacterium]|nr:SMC family ATPase [Cyanobacteriota bacterium]